MKEFIKNSFEIFAIVVNCCTFAATVPVLLPIRTACGSSYFIPSRFLHIVINVNPITNG